MEKGNIDYLIVQLITNVRTGEESMLDFGVEPALEHAKKRAKAELKKSRWAIIERKVVAISPTKKEPTS